MAQQVNQRAPKGALQHPNDVNDKGGYRIKSSWHPGRDRHRPEGFKLAPFRGSRGQPKRMNLFAENFDRIEKLVSCKFSGRFLKRFRKRDSGRVF